MPSVPEQRYVVTASTAGGGVGEIMAKNASIRFDRSFADASASQLPGPGELLAAAFAACIIKNVERFGQMLPFSYEFAEIEVELHRQDRPPRFDRVDYTLRLVTNEPDRRIDLLAKNLAKYGTVYNTLAASCVVSGNIERITRTADHGSTDD